MRQIYWYGTVVYSRISHFVMLCRTSARWPIIITNSNKPQLPVYENNKLLRHQKLCSKRRKLLYTLEHHPAYQLGCQADLQTDNTTVLHYDKCSQYLQNPAVSSAGTCSYIKEAYKVQYKPTGIENSMDCYPRKHSVNMCWLQTSAFHTCRHANAYFTLVKVLVLPGNCFFPLFTNNNR